MGSNNDFWCFKGVTYVALTLCFKLRSFLRWSTSAVAVTTGQHYGAACDAVSTVDRVRWMLASAINDQITPPSHCVLQETVHCRPLTSFPGHWRHRLEWSGVEWTASTSLTQTSDVCYSGPQFRRQIHWQVCPSPQGFMSTDVTSVNKSELNSMHYPNQTMFYHCCALINRSILLSQSRRRHDRQLATQCSVYVVAGFLLSASKDSPVHCVISSLTLNAILELSFCTVPLQQFLWQRHKNHIHSFIHSFIQTQQAL